MNRQALAWIAGVFGMTVLAGCGQGNAANGAGKAPPPPEVEVVTVVPVDLAQTVTLPGRVQARRTAQVRARVEGIVEARLFAEGSDIAAGAPLFRLDDRILKANEAIAAATVRKAMAEADNARANLSRLESLAEKNVASAQALDQARARARQAEADVAVAQAQHTRASVDASYALVSAPIAGHIGRALVSEGALVGKGEATHLATIEQLDPVYVNFTQSSADFLHLRESLANGRSKAPNRTNVRLLREDGSVYEATGSLKFTDLAIDPATGSVAMRAEFPNPKRLLLPGQFVSVEIPVVQAAGALAVPQRAVQASAQGASVLLVTEANVVKPQAVKTGGLAGDRWIITSGLKGGERVIVNGLQKARPGSPVTPVAVDAGAPQLNKGR